MATTTTTTKNEKGIVYNLTPNKFGGITESPNFLETLRDNTQGDCVVRRKTCFGTSIIEVSLKGEELFHVSRLDVHDPNWEVLKIALDERLFNCSCDYSHVYKFLPVIIDGVCSREIDNTWEGTVMQGKFEFEKYSRTSICNMFKIIFLKDQFGEYHHVGNFKI
jgi:hypothetical protein